jgi:hypothetical protein
LWPQIGEAPLFIDQEMAKKLSPAMLDALLEDWGDALELSPVIASKCTRISLPVLREAMARGDLPAGFIGEAARGRVKRHRTIKLGNLKDFAEQKGRLCQPRNMLAPWRDSRKNERKAHG